VHRIQDRMAEPCLIEHTRRDRPQSQSYLCVIRERFDDDGTVTRVSTRRIYDGGIIDDAVARARGYALGHIDDDIPAETAGA
jgi:hypothetical protein